MNRRLTSSLFASLIATAAPGAAVAKPATPEPPDRTKDLACLVGHWTGSGTLHADGVAEPAAVRVDWTCQPVSGTAGVRCDLVMTGIPGLDAYLETDLFGWEPASDTYHWFAVTNAGETHDHVAPPVNGDSVRFTYMGRQAGKPMKEVIDLTFGSGSTTVKVVSEAFVAGKRTSHLEVMASKGR